MNVVPAVIAGGTRTMGPREPIETVTKTVMESVMVGDEMEEEIKTASEERGGEMAAGTVIMGVQAGTVIMGVQAGTVIMGVQGGSEIQIMMEGQEEETRIEILVAGVVGKEGVGGVGGMIVVVVVVAAHGGGTGMVVRLSGEGGDLGMSKRLAVSVKEEVVGGGGTENKIEAGTEVYTCILYCNLYNVVKVVYM